MELRTLTLQRTTNIVTKLREDEDPFNLKLQFPAVYPLLLTFREPLMGAYSN